MKREFQFGFVSVVIGLLTVTAIYCAWLNFQKEKEYAAPYDGVWWVERAGAADAYDSRLVAKRVDEGGPAERAGVKAGDELLSVGGTEVSNTRRAYGPV
jgi:S1-C subfamily serine protease